MVKNKKEEALGAFGDEKEWSILFMVEESETMDAFKRGVLKGEFVVDKNEEKFGLKKETHCQIHEVKVDG